jgi:hypothetical protein
MTNPICRKMRMMLRLSIAGSTIKEGHNQKPEIQTLKEIDPIRMPDKADREIEDQLDKEHLDQETT